MFDAVEILVDKSGAVRVVIPRSEDDPEEMEPIELECVRADEPFAPQE